LDKHRVVIGWLFEAMTMLLAVFIAFTWKKAFGAEGSPQEQQIILYAVTIAVLFLAVGLTLLLNYRYAAWICVPFSVVMLIYFPIGTALGSYYLWYFWKFIYIPKKPT
jgi:NADH:ubiquinone oxidoreductase subunit K